MSILGFLKDKRYLIVFYIILMSFISFNDFIVKLP